MGLFVGCVFFSFPVLAFRDSGDSSSRIMSATEDEAPPPTETSWDRPLFLKDGVRSDQNVASAFLSLLKEKPVLVGLPTVPPLRLDAVTRVPGRAGLSDVVYVRFVQTVGALDIEGSEITATVRFVPLGTLVVRVQSKLFPELKKSPGDPPSEATGRSLFLSGSGFDGTLQSKGVRVRWMKGRWRAVRDYVLEETGDHVTVDDAGEPTFFEKRYYTRNYQGTATGRGVFFDPATTGDNLVTMPIADLRISLPGVLTSYTNSVGEFKVSDAPDTISSFAIGLWGRWTKVITRTGAALGVTLSGSVPNPVPMVFNPSGHVEVQTAQVNAYVHTTRVHNWLGDLSVAPSGINYTLATYVNETSSSLPNCNAYYGGWSIHFLLSGGGCRNTAIDTVIYHEYGHFVDDMIGGITNGALSEGWGDTLASYLSGQPLVGEGFFTSGGYVRTVDNSYVYNPLDAIHTQGQAWSGFAWDLRKNLMASQGASSGVALAENLVVPTLWANSTDIPSAVRDLAIRDDDDGNLTNGTPHFNEIVGAAMAHGVAGKLNIQTSSGTLLYSGNGSSVSGVVNLEGSVSSGVLVSRVLILVDGVESGVATGTNRWTYNWDTRSTGDGPHTLSAWVETGETQTAVASVCVRVANNSYAGSSGPLSIGEAYVYPHPVAGGEATFYVEADGADAVSLRVVSLTGETVFRADTVPSGTTSNGQTVFECVGDLGSLSSGTYHWVVEARNASTTTHLLKKMAVAR